MSAAYVYRNGAGWLHCPWCGKTPDCLIIMEGETYRWMLVIPDCCGNVMGEVARTRDDTPLGNSLNQQSAVKWWNERQR